MEEKAGNKSKEELIAMMEDMQYNRSCMQKMVHTLIDPQDMELDSKAYKIMLVVM
jgi:hypothetical protein